MLLVIFVTACGSDSSDQHQFASDSGPTAPLPTMPPTPTPNRHQPAQAATPVAISQILTTKSGPARIYFQAGSAVWTANADGSANKKLWSADNATLKTMATSPDAAQVALLFASGKTGSSWSILVLDAAGHQQARIDGIDTLFGSPLPANAAASLSWSPKGDQLLLAVTGGGIAAIPLHGKPTVFVSARQAAAPHDPAWSPKGNAIAFLDPATSTKPANLYVARTGAVPLDPASIVSGPGQRSITQFTWSPTDHDIFYIQAKGDHGAASQGGDIFAISAAGQDRRLVVSGGSGGPVAEIVAMALSPDGKSIAYTVFQPNGNRLTFLSLWVQRIGTPYRVRLPVPAGQTVTDLWWTKSGLVWRTAQDASGAAAYTGGTFSLYRADSQGNAIRLLHLGPAELGTPAASPAATPNATPVGSPQVSPVATPAEAPSSPEPATPTG